MALSHALSGRVRPLVRSVLCPQTVRTNQASGLIKLIACICMAIDHAGKMIFPQYPVLRLIGRLAFPLFAYGIAVGSVYTRDPIRYLSRIVLLALISQPLYALGLAHENSAMYSIPFFENPILSCWRFYISSWQKPSILLSLALGLCILIALKKRQWVLAIGVYILCARFSSYLDYGISGIQLMVLFYALCEHPYAALLVISGYMISWASGSGYVFFGQSFGMRIFALPAGIFACLPIKRPHLRLPRWLIYGFYPAHLIILALLTKVFHF